MRKPGHRSRAGNHARESVHGFTLMETIATLVVIAIMAVVFAAAASRTGAEVASEAAILRGHLRFAQAMAMANNTIVWSVQVDGAGYTLQRDGAPSVLHLPDENSPTHVLARRVSIAQGTGVLTFNEWGECDLPRTIVLGDGETQQSVTILEGTGLIP